MARGVVNATDENLHHDAAVAHALVKAMAAFSKLGGKGADYICKRAAEILRDDFGIED